MRPFVVEDDGGFAQLRCSRAGRRQRGAVRCDQCAARRRERAARRMRAEAFPRRQQPPHAQPPLHARRAGGRADRSLSGRGILAGSAQGHRRRDERDARAHDDPAHGDVPAMDDRARRAVPAFARRHAARVAHQRVLPRRGQGARQRVLPGGRGARRGGELRHRGDRPRASRRALRIGERRAPRHRVRDRREGDGGRSRRLRGEPRMVERSVGTGRRQSGDGSSPGNRIRSPSP